MIDPTPRQSETAASLAPGVWVVKSRLRFAFSRASGPGGQAVNKLSTKAELRVRIGDIHGLDEQAAMRLRRLAGRRVTDEDEIIIQGQTHRSQLDNKLECIDRLGGLIKAALVRPKVRRKKKPSRSMIEKRLESKRVQADKKRRRGSRGGRGGEFD